MQICEVDQNVHIELKLLFTANNQTRRAVVQWCNPLTLQLERSGGQGCMSPSDKGSQTRLGLRYFCDHCAWC